MGRLKRRCLQAVSGMLFALAVVATTAVPAQAVKWYPWDGGGCGTFFTYICDVQYTGSWPTGQVRGVGQRNVHQVALQSKPDGGSWVTVASTYPINNGGTFITPAVPAGKFNYYRSCFRLISSGPLWCSKNGGIYLGD
ncbi:hypothetical protein Ais01nite_74090 [Asanoa ishikariensis]|uniref:Secreted protein n=1 Tax=Asanoa ishikariensis TaxID=137265 RepID=A0A1H3URV3_9ACTN|nr:hypothetical protein Ais01nite_74090 [Asanoa ishikariensis]SDZ65122.1 hypothetical protein SAMN05421684_7934 [Asanoa ishikariensis]